MHDMLEAHNGSGRVQGTGGLRGHVRPIRMARLRKTKNPGWRYAGTPLWPKGNSPIEIKTGLGSDSQTPDSYFVHWAQHIGYAGDQTGSRPIVQACRNWLRTNGVNNNGAAPATMLSLILSSLLLALSLLALLLLLLLSYMYIYIYRERERCI